MVHVVLIDFHSQAPPPSPTFVERGEIFLFTSGNWGGGVSFFFEATIKADPGETFYARLYDKTAGAAVSGSEVNTTATDFERKRSPAITLTNGNEYVVQYGAIAGKSGQYRGGKIMVN